jgi:hypothetical protein
MITENNYTHKIEDIIQIASQCSNWKEFRSEFPKFYKSLLRRVHTGVITLSDYNNIKTQNRTQYTKNSVYKK